MITIELIKQWGHDRKITINGNHQTQWLKLVSEYGELADNLAKGKDIRDDIGDMFVVLVMICELGKVDIQKSFDLVHVQTRVDADLMELIGAIHIDVGALRFRVSTGRAADLISSLLAMAKKHNHTLYECIEMAYEDIKDRKGFLNAEGVFIKEAQS
jgi:NTP pyrophosphatase (non-canonical NTP hydrolase)